MHHMGQTRYPALGYKRVHSNSIADKPHSHSRERLRYLLRNIGKLAAGPRTGTEMVGWPFGWM